MKRGLKNHHPPTITFDIFDDSPIKKVEEEKRLSFDDEEEEKKFQEIAQIYKSVLLQKDKIKLPESRDKVKLNKRLSAAIDSATKKNKSIYRTSPGINIIGIC